MAIDYLADALDVLEDHGETVVYVPRAGIRRTITANVVQVPEDEMPDAGFPARAWRITVANDATQGIAASEIDRGGDAIELDDRYAAGGTREFEIHRIVSVDTGGITFEVR